jgi:hypothetical protein
MRPLVCFCTLSCARRKTCGNQRFHLPACSGKFNLNARSVHALTLHIAPTEAILLNEFFAVWMSFLPFLVVPRGVLQWAVRPASFRIRAITAHAMPDQCAWARLPHSAWQLSHGCSFRLQPAPAYARLQPVPLHSGRMAFGSTAALCGRLRVRAPRNFRTI